MLLSGYIVDRLWSTRKRYVKVQLSNALHQSILFFNPRLQCWVYSMLGGSVCCRLRGFRRGFVALLEEVRGHGVVVGWWWRESGEVDASRHASVTNACNSSHRVAALLSSSCLVLEFLFSFSAS